MFGLIVRNQLREIVGTTRFAATFGVVALLILLAFHLGGRHYLSSRGQYEAAVTENLRQLEALAARLDEERLNRQHLQERLAFGLARISPTAAFSIAALELTGTALELPRHYLDQARAYQRVFERFQKEKTGGRSSGGVMVLMRAAGQDDEEVAIDPHELPAFDYQDPPAAEILRGAVFDLGLLVLFNVLFFAGGFVAFLRYDVR